MNERPLDDWIDGRLEAEERVAFGQRLEAEPEVADMLALQGRMEDSLRRLFPVPATVAVQPPVTPAAPPRPGGVSIFPWPVLAAAGVAATLLLASLLWQHRGVPVSSQVETLAMVDPGELLACETLLPDVGPPSECIATGPERKQADLGMLYAEFSGLEGTMFCSDSDNLAARLSEAYGCCTDLEVKPESAFMLQGPYTSETWPTGTILTGEGDVGTSVIVAELASNLDCCLDPYLAADSDLNLYTWRVSEMVFTEITPDDEPQFLGCFELN